MSLPKKICRNPKTTSEQLDILVNYLKENKLMLDMKTHPLKPNEIKLLWETLTELLNNTTKGAKKNVDEWKRFLVTWKSKTKNKARQLKKEQTGTGGGPSTIPPLTDYEEKLLNLIGWNTITGCNSVAPELHPEATEQIIHEKNVIIEEGVLLDLDISNFLEENEDFPVEVMINQKEPEQPKPNLPLSSNMRTRKEPRKRSSHSQLAPTESLEKSAKIYSESSEKISESLCLMSKSVDALASAISKYAEAMFAMAEAKKQKYSNKFKNCPKCRED